MAAAQTPQEQQGLKRTTADMFEDTEAQIVCIRPSSTPSPGCPCPQGSSRGGEGGAASASEVSVWRERRPGAGMALGLPPKAAALMAWSSVPKACRLRDPLTWEQEKPES